jgi:phosphoribosylformylglycinamidine cyclo-ligase
LFVAQRDAERTVDVARALGIGARVAGNVRSGPKELVIQPLGLRYDAADLQLR